MLIKRPVTVKGHVRLWRRGLLVVDRPNLTVTAGTSAYAELVGGGPTANWGAVAFGIGSGTAAPAKSDTDLGATPKYYRGLNGSPSYPQAGTVSLPIGVTTADYAGYGITIAEIGLYANSALVKLPSAVGTSFGGWSASTAKAVGAVITATAGSFRSVAPAAWSASTTYAAGVLITDSNGNIQKCTTAGTSGASHPSWATAVNSTTTDDAATWTCVALSGYSPTTGSAAPSWNASSIGNLTFDGTVVWQWIAGNSVPTPMLAHASVPSFTFGGSANYTGTWNLTFGV